MTVALYDPNEFPETKTVSPDFTLEDVLAWARTKPRDGWYDYCDPSNCAVCQFLIETGRATAPAIGFNEIEEAGAETRYFDERIARAANSALETGWTFGAFADRLEQAMSA